MYTYYVIRLDFENGEWGYVAWTGIRGQYELVEDAADARVFDTKSEASDFYYDVIGSQACFHDSPLKKVYISTIETRYPR